MKGQELFYPDIRVQMGDYVFAEGISLEIFSDRSSSFDWAKIRFTEEFQDTITLRQMDPVRICLGYDGMFQEVFSGYVTKNYNHASGADEILVKDEMLKFGGTFITETFLETVPQEIASYALSRAGVTEMHLLEDLYIPKHKVPIVRKSILELLKYLQKLWNMGEILTCWRDGAFYWGVTPPQKQVYQFVYGENIIWLSRQSGLWELTTVSMPFIRHSDRIQVEHPKISGTFEVQKMEFSTNQNGFIRTTICFV